MDVSEGTEEEDSEQEELHLMQQAVAEKERGNEYFKVWKKLVCFGVLYTLARSQMKNLSDFKSFRALSRKVTTRQPLIVTQREFSAIRQIQFYRQIERWPCSRPERLPRRKSTALWPSGKSLSCLFYNNSLFFLQRRSHKCCWI